MCLDMRTMHDIFMREGWCQDFTPDEDFTLSYIGAYFTKLDVKETVYCFVSERKHGRQSPGYLSVSSLQSNAVSKDGSCRFKFCPALDLRQGVEYACKIVTKNNSSSLARNDGQKIKLDLLEIINIT